MEEQHRNALKPGSHLQWYQILKVLGQGGFGITYLARDNNLNIQVAIKEYLPNELALREGDATVHPISDTHGDRFEWGRSRFMDEARMLAGFDHPAILRVLAFFEANNTAYMVMRYEAGQSLQRVLEHGLRPDEQQLTGLLQPLFDGLDIIHARRIIHRDIKPDNIFIREDNGPVLLDFGSARHAIGSAGQTLTMLVSPGFAPIEQYSREKETQGPWTDIYALGATLYRAVSSQAPVDSMQRSISIHHDGPDPLRPLLDYNPTGFSPGFLAAIDAALAFKAADRPQTIAEWRAMFSFDTDARPAPIALPSDEAPTERPSTQIVSDSASGNAGTAPARRATAGRQGQFRKYTGIAAVVLAAMTAGGWWLYHAIERGVDTQLPMLRDPLVGGGRGPIMVVVPAGGYLMGSPATEKDRETDEGPQQTISIPQAFAVSRTEITVEQFRTFIEDSGYITEVEQTGGCYHRTDVWNQYASLNWRNPGYTQGDDEPVVCVSRHDAEAYAIWLTTQSGRDYRLPTEAEWEYFSRAGTKTSRYWGDNAADACHYANVADQRTASLIPNMSAHPCRDESIFTESVRSYEPNAFGIYDTLGNVWEYTSDCWTERLDGPCTGGPAVRGGSWSSPPKYLRSANRTEDTRGSRSDFGFRVVAEVELGEMSEE